ncbi:MAG: DUF4173 domain-containing protein [Coriobacteriia bacterium]|nr:DUF4173 domain-containing protein [Coriobacteriia bacterium]MCL2750539.1 DUF4173 domain-containing protein [Coriobacteriia bacterium]
MDASQGQGSALPKNEYPAPTGEPVCVAWDALPDEGAQSVIGVAPQDKAAGKAAKKSADKLADPPCKTQYLPEAMLALALLALGFFYWEWNLLFGAAEGLGSTLFFLLCITAALIYMRAKGLRQNAKSRVALAVAVAGALPFVLYGGRDFNILIWLFEASACLIWVAYSCRSIIIPRLSGFIVMDLINQVFIVPLVNCYRFFVCLFKWKPSEGQRALGAVAIALIGIIIFIPLFVLICTLLAESDDGFAKMLADINETFLDFNWEAMGLNFFLGIPLAVYIFGSIEGNAARRHCDNMSYDGLQRLYVRLQRIRGLAFYVPLASLVVLYVSYFIAMGTYLTSGLAGDLPETYTYAEYARQGFFELCGVASINLLILGVVYLLAKRQPGTFPLAIRLLTAALTLLTIALVVTAGSKMLLYIGAYGLSPLRLYTSVFMLLLLVVFTLLLVWHIKPYNAARPCIAATVVLFLALSFTNTDGIIANYNVNQYLNGHTKRIDTQMLGGISDATLPALFKLSEQTTDFSVWEDALWRIQYKVQEEDQCGSMKENNRWYNWNLIRYLSLNELDEKTKNRTLEQLAIKFLMYEAGLHNDRDWDRGKASRGYPLPPRVSHFPRPQ